MSWLDERQLHGGMLDWKMTYSAAALVVLAALLIAFLIVARGSD